MSLLIIVGSFAVSRRAIARRPLWFGLGLALDPDIRTSHEMAVATHDLDTPVGVIPEGTVAAQRFTWEGTVGGVPR